MSTPLPDAVFTPPADYEFEPELQGMPPREVPGEVWHGLYAQRRRRLGHRRDSPGLFRLAVGEESPSGGCRCRERSGEVGAGALVVRWLSRRAVGQPHRRFVGRHLVNLRAHNGDRQR